jgi:hypothetical protein
MFTIGKWMPKTGSKTPCINRAGQEKKVNNKIGKRNRKAKLTGKITDQNETTTTNKVTLSR